MSGYGFEGFAGTYPVMIAALAIIPCALIVMLVLLLSSWRSVQHGGKRSRWLIGLIALAAVLLLIDLVVLFPSLDR